MLLEPSRHRHAGPKPAVLYVLADPARDCRVVVAAENGVRENVNSYENADDVVSHGA